MLNENFVVKLTENILKRYEPSIEDGITLLFDVKTEKLWVGNSSSNDLIKLIDGKRNIKEIYMSLQPMFNGYSYDELKHSFDDIILDLINKKFLEFVSL